MLVCWSAGVELHNSSSSSPHSLAKGLESALAVGANSVLAPVAWEDIEPVEGVFQLAQVTDLVESTRRAGLHLIILWFGAWKNGASTYAPAWVKRDWTRFTRCVLDDGRLTETLSPFTDEVLDAPAFAELMRHIERIDGEHGTVLMVQVENEVGLLGATRDHSLPARAAFTAPVPQRVVHALESRPREEQGANLGSWPDVLPSPDRSDEAFMAYGIATHVERVAVAGRRHSALPLFVNAWLGSDLDVDLPGFAVAGGQRPGNYPSGGPLPHVADIWHACAPTIDLLAPDLYFGDSLTILSRLCRHPADCSSRKCGAT
jgi:beta-galactosidase GanA